MSSKSGTCLLIADNVTDSLSMLQKLFTVAYISLLVVSFVDIVKQACGLQYIHPYEFLLGE